MTDSGFEPRRLLLNTMLKEGLSFFLSFFLYLSLSHTHTHTHLTGGFGGPQTPEHVLKSSSLIIITHSLVLQGREEENMFQTITWTQICTNKEEVVMVL